MKRKRLLFIFALLGVMALLCGRVSFAQESTLPSEVTIALGETDFFIAAGEEITVPVSAKTDLSGLGVISVQFKILYDPAVVEATDVLPGIITENIQFQFNIHQDIGQIDIASATSGFLEGMGGLAVLKFRVLHPSVGNISQIRV